jgi:hypothetical protein
MVVYRVSFVGAELTRVAKERLTDAGVTWEGTESAPETPSHYRALVAAPTESEATATVRKVLAGYGSFSQYGAAPVTDARGEIWRRPFYRSWDEIDWQAVPARASLSDLERAVLHCLLAGLSE